MSRSHPPGAVAAPADRPARGFVDTGLRLLQTLNTLRTAEGQRLSSRLTFEGYEPWWFFQDDLLWEILIPWVRERASGARLLAGELRLEAAPARIRRLWSRLGLPGAAALARRPAGWGAGQALARFALLAETTLALVWSRLRRRDTILFILDSVSPGARADFRLTAIYRELDRRGYRWVEYLHSRGGARGAGESWRNLLRRRRPAIYQNLPLKLYKGTPPEPPRLARPEGLADADWVVLEAVARWHWARIHRLPDKIHGLRRLLRLQRVRRAVLTDDMRHVVPLAVACRLEGVSTLAFQHGLFNRFHPTLMGYGFDSARRHTFDLYGVWSEYYRKRLEQGRLYDESNSFAAGPLRAPTAAELERAVAPRPAGELPVRALVVSEPLPPRDQVLAHIRELLADGRFRITWKLRPGEEPPRLELPEPEAARLRIQTTGTVYEAFAGCDVVLGTYSSVLYEGAAALKPAVVLHTDLTYGYDIVADGLADFVDQPAAAPEVVWRAAETPVEVLEGRRERIWGTASADGAVTLFDAAEARLWEPPRAAGSRG